MVNETTRQQQRRNALPYTLLKNFFVNSLQHPDASSFISHSVIHLDVKTMKREKKGAET